MELTLDQALAGRSTRIKNNEFLPTAAYIEPFIERMSKYTDNFIINGILPNQITFTQDGDINTEDLTFNRMWVQAVFPDENCFDNHERVIGMVYGLDVTNPVVKFYSGGLNMACCNLCVFSPSYLSVDSIEPNKALNYKSVDYLLDQKDEVKEILTRLTNTEVPYNEVRINENLGEWTRNALHMTHSNKLSKAKIAVSSVISAYKLLYEDKESPYYVQEGTTTNMFNIYNAWTQVITDDKRDILTKCEKTILTKRILGI